MRSRANILVVDDEGIVRDGCMRILGKEDCNVQVAESGNEGLEFIKQKGFDIVLLDLKMPGMSGMEVLRIINEAYPDIIVIVITGYATVESAVEAMKEGAYDYIPKPFTPDQLRIVVRRAIEKKALLREAEYLRQEREKGLQDIATERSKVKTIINCMADGVLVTDREGGVVLHNPAAMKMLGIMDTSIVGKPLSQSIKDKNLAELATKVLTTADTDHITISQELPLGESGETVLMAHLAPVKNEAGEVLGSVTVLQDISQLKAIDKMKSDFVAMVAHEFKSPLSSIQQQMSVILGGMAGEVNERQRKILGRVKERTQGLLKLISDLLDISKIEAGIVVQHKEPLQLTEIIQETTDLIRFQAEAKNITLRLSVAPSLPMINADRHDIEEAFTNLIDNALRYTPEGGQVTIRAGTKGEYLHVEVSDTGIGISKEDLPRIFDKFYRVKTDQTRHITGSGLGLSIVKGIVEAYFGSIQVESEVGKGTTFTVLLPRGFDASQQT